MRAVRVALVLAALALASGRADPAAPDYFIVVTGGELLEGAYPDAHTHFLTRTLRPLGLRCAGALVVDDRREDLLAALHFATNRAGLVLVTGGLGPTPNDITRETLSEFTGIPLRESEAAVAELERRFSQPRDQLRPNLRRQCQVPERGGFFPNPRGTAVGLVFDLAPGALIALPGPPRELQPMVRDEVLPWLRRRYGVREPGASLTLRFVGVGQSQIDHTIQERVALPPEVIVTSLFEGSRVDFTFSLPGHTERDVERLRQLGAEVRRHLGEFCYAEGETTLEEVVLRAVRNHGARLTLAEVASGGALAAALSSAPAVADVVRGSFVAPTEDQLGGLLEAGRTAGEVGSEARVRALADSAAKHGGTRWAVVVGEAHGDAGERRVWLAFKTDSTVKTRRLAAGEPSTAGRAGLVTSVLDQVRRWLQAP
jgi:nicotinamide-nucleotide amidase